MPIYNYTSKVWLSLVSRVGYHPCYQQIFYFIDYPFLSCSQNAFNTTFQQAKHDSLHSLCPVIAAQFTDMNMPFLTWMELWRKTLTEEHCGSLSLCNSQNLTFRQSSPVLCHRLRGEIVPVSRQTVEIKDDCVEATDVGTVCNKYIHT